MTNEFDLVGMDAQQLAVELSPAELTELKAAWQDSHANEVVPERWIASAPGMADIHVRAGSREEAVELVCLYLGCEPQGVLVAGCKRCALPRRGDRVLRSSPVAGSGAPGFAYGVE